jgi:hypothetical protein
MTQPPPNLVSVLSSSAGCIGTAQALVAFRLTTPMVSPLAYSRTSMQRSKRLRRQIRQEIDMPEHKTLSPTLKPPEFSRDRMGRFERPGATLKKVQKTGHRFKKGQAPGPGRPPGVQNRITVALKDAILAAGEAAGGEKGLTGYLTRLAVENSSAYAGLLAKVLPTTLAADESNGGLGVKMVFERHIVWPDGRREIEGVTPKQLPAPEPDETKAIEP